MSIVTSLMRTVCNSVECYIWFEDIFDPWYCFHITSNGHLEGDIYVFKTTTSMFTLNRKVSLRTVTIYQIHESKVGLDREITCNTVGFTFGTAFSYFLNPKIKSFQTLELSC